ncbi:MAG: hypothetical protein R6X34_10220, partial [Chloroflexota bacterium]
MLKQRLARIFTLALILGLLLWLLTPNWPKFGDEKYQLEAIVGGRTFDFVTWEVNAMAAKATAVLSG